MKRSSHYALLLALVACAGGGSSDANLQGPAADDAAHIVRPNGQAVPRSAIQMGPLAHKPPGKYTTQTMGPYVVMNNTWGTGALPLGWSQQTGISPLQADGSIAFAAAWHFPTHCATCEVLSYPEVIYGRTAGVDPAPGALLPRRLQDIRALHTEYSRIEGQATGLGQVTYDVWISRSPTSMDRTQRVTELMLPVEPIGGYGVPNDPPEAAAGRDGQPGAGRDARYYVERTTINGLRYDVYHTPPRGNVSWDIVVYQPVLAAGRQGQRLNWLPFLQYAQSKGWAPKDGWLASVELGVEAVTTPGGSTGDLTVSGFKVSLE